MKNPAASYGVSARYCGSRRANFVIMRRPYRTLNDYEMRHNTEVRLFTRPSTIDPGRKNLYVEPITTIRFFLSPKLIVSSRYTGPKSPALVQAYKGLILCTFSV